MNDTIRRILTLQSKHEQDIAQVKDWMREQSDEALLLIWAKIQKEYPNPFTEAMTRFAQIGMTEIALRIANENQDGDTNDPRREDQAQG